MIRVQPAYDPEDPFARLFRKAAGSQWSAAPDPTITARTAATGAARIPAQLAAYSFTAATSSPRARLASAKSMPVFGSV